MRQLRIGATTGEVNAVTNLIINLITIGMDTSV